MHGMSLLDVLRGVMLDPAEQAAYRADPSAYLGRFGYDDVDPVDLSEAFGLVADTLPPAQAQAAWATAGPGPLGARHDLDDLDHGGDAALPFGGAPADPLADHDLGGDDPDDFDQLDGYGSVDDGGPDVGSF